MKKTLITIVVTAAIAIGFTLMFLVDKEKGADTILAEATPGNLVNNTREVSGNEYFNDSGLNEVPADGISTKTISGDSEEVAEEDYYNEAELVDFTKQYISVLQRLYYVNQDDSVDADTVTGLIISMLSEAMKDRDNLEKLLYTTSQMKESKILGADVTGLVMDVSVQQLISSHNEYIDFLRGVDEATADIAEFQYQIAQFQSSTKSTYLSMAENTGIFPMTFLDLNDDPNLSGTWRISKESKDEILDEIELRFGDIFIENDQQYLETQTRDVTVFIVQSLKDFIETT